MWTPSSGLPFKIANAAMSTHMNAGAPDGRGSVATSGASPLMRELLAARSPPPRARMVDVEDGLVVGVASGTEAARVEAIVELAPASVGGERLDGEFVMASARRA